MSATIQARGVGASFGDRELFSGLDLIVAPGDVLGLVGPHGAGKSTLLRILAGVRSPDRGTVTLSPRDARLGLLTQVPDRRPDETIRQQLVRRTGVGAANAAMEAAADALAAGRPGADDAYADSLDAWLGLGGGDLDERLEIVADDLGLAIDLDRPSDSLSGGQAARVSLAGLLLSRYDAYLLDEPTNDLDVAGLDRLEEFVDGLDAPCVVVSHDREFLSRTVTAVVEIDRSLLTVATYGGSYDAYLEERTIARRRARESFEEYAARRSALDERARRQRAWMDKGTRNALRKKRSGSERDKFIRAHAVATSEKQAAKARQTERMIERLEVIEEPRKEWDLQFTIASAGRSGDIVAVASGAVAERGDFHLGPVTLHLDSGDRVAITGPNGSGKTTLLGLLLGRIPAVAGSVGLGPSVVIGEVDQARAAFESQLTLVRAFEEEMPAWSHAEVRTLLAKFGLRADHIARRADSLSPGERTRAALALLQARGVNLLVLDEPTNHLDLPAIEQLEQAIDGFDGTVLLVTHDRRMLSTVRLTRRWEVDEGRVREITA